MPASERYREFDIKQSGKSAPEERGLAVYFQTDSVYTVPPQIKTDCNVPVRSRVGIGIQQQQCGQERRPCELSSQ